MSRSVYLLVLVLSQALGVVNSCESLSEKKDNEFGRNDGYIWVKHGVSEMQFHRSRYRVLCVARQLSSTNYDGVLPRLLRNSFDVSVAPGCDIPESEDWLNVGYTREGILLALAVHEKELCEYGSGSMWGILVAPKIGEECGKLGVALEKMQEIANLNLGSLPTGCLLIMLGHGVFCYKDQYMWGYDVLRENELKLQNQ
jgi:hypothetical protein